MGMHGYFHFLFNLRFYVSDAKKSILHIYIYFILRSEINFISGHWNIQLVKCLVRADNPVEQKLLCHFSHLKNKYLKIPKGAVPL
jgi:hypothetical protein